MTVGNGIAQLSGTQLLDKEPCQMNLPSSLSQQRTKTNISVALPVKQHWEFTGASLGTESSCHIVRLQLSIMAYQDTEPSSKLYPKEEQTEVVGASRTARCQLPPHASADGTMTLMTQPVGSAGPNPTAPHKHTTRGVHHCMSSTRR